MPDKHDTTDTGWFQKGNRKIIAIVTGTALLVGGAFGVQAVADSKAYSHMKLAVSDDGGWSGGGWHHAGWRGHGRMRLADMTEAEIEDRIERIVKHVAIEIDATEDQQKKITALVTAVAKDLKPLRDDMRVAGKDLHNLLVADTIDRAALEKLRAERLAEVDRISKNLVDAVADVAEVLTPEQRKVLDKRIQQFRSMRRGWRRG